MPTALGHSAGKSRDGFVLGKFEMFFLPERGHEIAWCSMSHFSGGAGTKHRFLVKHVTSLHIDTSNDSLGHSSHLPLLLHQTTSHDKTLVMFITIRKQPKPISDLQLPWLMKLKNHSWSQGSCAAGSSSTWKIIEISMLKRINGEHIQPSRQCVIYNAGCIET